LVSWLPGSDIGTLLCQINRSYFRKRSEQEGEEFQAEGHIHTVMRKDDLNMIICYCPYPTSKRIYPQGAVSAIAQSLDKCKSLINIVE
jgi:hypothetical protein